MAQLTALVTEACNVATAAGAKVNQASVMDMFKTMPAEMRSSMQKDVERGNPTVSRFSTSSTSTV